MMENLEHKMQYIGEHLWAGQIGNAFVILSFVASLFATLAYYRSTTKNDLSWHKLARIGFWIHSLAVFGIVASLFVMLYKHYFEFEYVWHHSSKDLPLKYILSCFWEGQEGSFLLWSFWHVVLGNILIKTSKQWEAPVMTVISSVQVFLASMLLGINIFGYHLGSNPFTVLLREHPDFLNIPLFTNANYLEKLDGRGLNLLLRNYWMVIHPPTLFLGFAATVVPFAYAIAGLWKRRYNEWQKPALTWTYFGVMILGTGILMGGAWAYEALSFGGFWAWDPVENASLVPWITLVGAAHVMLINKNKGTSLGLTFFLTILTFILILYSTFLTRSGILGESSVHAFTDLGMSGQLLIYLLFYIAISLFLIIRNWKQLPKQAEEEALTSREFWMFVGSLVLLISAFQITYTTSIPVWNKLFGLKLAPPIDRFEHYHSWQLPLGFIVAVLIAIAQFFKYKKTDVKEFYKKIIVSLVVALVLTVLVAVLVQMVNPLYLLFLFASLFSISANFDYLIRILKGKIKNGGASVAHIGFGLILLGVLLSTSGKKFISENTAGNDLTALDKNLSNSKNILLTQGDTLPMGDYFVTYSGKHKGETLESKSNVYFEINYFTKSGTGKYEHAFTLEPFVQRNPRMGTVAEPDTRHFLFQDIYTHITFADAETFKEEVSANSYSEPKIYQAAIGEEFSTSSVRIKLDTISAAVDKQALGLADHDIGVVAHLSVTDVSGKTITVTPVFVVKNNAIQSAETVVSEMGLRILFQNIHPDTGKLEFAVAEKQSRVRDFVVMEAIVFPFINVLWLGCFVMIVGTILAINNRIKKG